ncbi:flagellar basal body-associated protein FliL [Vogesella sp. LIG4]|uniref:flagellar basal body-associated FliL family protein n=1 Tax=Vogesella sp. LIG4 TaxID=1192162 RepID=UPI00081FC9FB|nr:flagellar basal body-associated FliL family protein [Vogesella sp. LIG4]SCK17544.1 flagellar FliL protein [Vogesella sp. LIG4]
MANKKLFIGAAVITALLAGAGGSWFWLQWRDARPARHEAPVVEVKDYKYVSLDKVIVMLRDHAGAPLNHYLAVDLVFRTSGDDEAMTKEHLPLLRSIALRALSAYPMDQARLMNIDQFAAALNKAFSAAYQREGRPKPFTEAMIGKLIIE